MASALMFMEHVVITLYVKINQINNVIFGCPREDNGHSTFAIIQYWFLGLKGIFLGVYNYTTLHSSYLGWLDHLR
jgi:hypothetical protein